VTSSTLRIRQITKTFGTTCVLRSVSLDLPAGTTSALLGPSGCGKTTLLRVIAGLEEPDSGEISVGSRILTGNANRVAPERRRVGMVFQDGALFPHLTVRDNVAYGLRRSKEARRRAAEVLNLVELSDFGDRYPDELSGGQQQRVAVARALAPGPDVLLLDEPFSSLDADLRERVRNQVVELLAELRITTLFVTHDQEEAFVVGERIAVMNEGRIVQEGPPSEIYHRPIDPWLAHFVGEANLLPAYADHRGASTRVGRIPTDSGTGPSLVLVRPEYLQLQGGGEGIVKSVDFFGHDTAYEVDGYGDTLLVRELRAPRFRVGDRVSVAYAGGTAVAFPAS
jgi:iron(III) transport system ATP-binding protein